MNVKNNMIKREAESPEIIKRRWDFKKEQIEILANNIQKLRYNVTLGLKDSENEKVFLTALVVAIILETSERVGNEASASNGHVGVCGLKKKQVSVDGNKVTLEYTGKSGVEHIKSFSDERIAKALKLAIKHSKTDDVFCTSDGFKIKADRINRFLSDFSVRAKDLRGMNSNKLMTDRLKSEEVPEDEKKRKKFFMQSLRKVAIKIGHGSATLRKHYLIPELEINYIKNGNIIDIKERDSYEEGGEIKSDNDKFQIPYIEKIKEVSNATLTPSKLKSDKNNNDIEFKCDYEKYFEYVPLSEIEKYIEFDREIEHKISKKYIDELTEEIKVNGITYPITLEVYGDKGLIVEGNHRIAVAKRLGIKHIPVRVVERSRPIKGTIYENKFKELPSRKNMEWAKVMYGVSFLDSENSASVYGFTNVKPDYKNGGEIKSELLAPNGKPSNLTPELHKLVRSKNFIEWFGDFINDPKNSSKAVDENGEPLILFHGSAIKFNIFDNSKIGLNYRESEQGGFFFTQKKRSAENYATLHSNLENKGFIYECFLNIKNPIIRNTDSDYYAPADRYDLSRNDLIIEIRNNKSLDGIIITGTKKDNLYVVLKSNQIKLANGENTTFGSSNPDIRFENGGEVVINDNFTKWFKGSKVVDEFGKPKTVYHGTNRKFNVFDSKEIGQGTGNLGHYGYGFYFSDDIIEAKGYGDVVLECYLSIKKPFTGTDEEFDLLKEAGFSGIANKVPLTIDFNDLHEKMKLVDSNAYEFMSIAKENGIDNVWSIYLQSHPHPHNHKIDLNDIYDILGYTDLFNQNNAVSDYAIEELNSFGIEPKLNYGYQYSQSLHWVTDLGNNSKSFTDFIKSLGYDGVIYGSEYVAFYPNQIKLSDGTNTDFDSENPDIRFENGGSLQDYLKRNNLEDNSYTEEDMDNFTNELNDELKKIGYITRVSKSKTNFGKSNYIFATNDVGNLYTPNEIKIRVSDHSVTNIDRIFNEFHISFPLKDKENSIKGALNKVKYYFDRGKHFYSKPINVEKKSYNVLTELPNKTDVVTKEWTTKKGKNMYEVTRTYLNEAIGYFSKDNDILYDTVFIDKFNNGGELIDEKVTFDNFYKGTTANFKEIMKEGIPKRKPDFISDFGSKYWFTPNSVIRQSDHWGQLDTCEWTLDSKSGNKYTQGICKLIDFKK